MCRWYALRARTDLSIFHYLPLAAEPAWSLAEGICRAAIQARGTARRRLAYVGTRTCFQLVAVVRSQHVFPPWVESVEVCCLYDIMHRGDDTLDHHLTSRFNSKEVTPAASSTLFYIQFIKSGKGTETPRCSLHFFLSSELACADNHESGVSHATSTLAHQRQPDNLRLTSISFQFQGGDARRRLHTILHTIHTITWSRRGKRNRNAHRQLTV